MNSLENIKDEVIENLFETQTYDKNNMLESDDILNEVREWKKRFEELAKFTSPSSENYSLYEDALRISRCVNINLLCFKSKKNLRLGLDSYSFEDVSLVVAKKLTLHKIENNISLDDKTVSKIQSIAFSMKVSDKKIEVILILSAPWNIEKSKDRVPGASTFILYQIFEAAKKLFTCSPKLLVKSTKSAVSYYDNLGFERKEKEKYDRSELTSMVFTAEKMFRLVTVLSKYAK